MINLQKPKSSCCGAKIYGVIDYGTMLGQLVIHKLRFCNKCKLILDGEGKGGFYTPKNK